MKLSIAAPQTGALATADAVAEVAALTESLDLHGLWVLDRLLLPVDPRDPYPATPDGVLSSQFEKVLDPISVLAFAAARTQRIRLGTGVLVTPWYSPVLLARSLASIDVLSGGRLDVGLGTGWSSDENEATGASTDHLGRRTDEFIDVLYRAWSDDVVEYDGTYQRVPASRIGLKPVQGPRPPVVFAAYSPSALRRIARVGDGWLPAGLPLDAMVAMWGGIRQMAEDFGRDPSELKLVVRANIFTTQRITAADRPLFQGDAKQIADDVRRCQEVGASEVVLDAQFSEASSGLRQYADAVIAMASACDDVVAESRTAVAV
jgi:probable F420-dependent oxidoreductase